MLLEITLILLGVLSSCRSTTPMVGVTQSQNTNTKVASGIGTTLTEPASETSLGAATTKEPSLCLFGKGLSELAQLSDFEIEKRGTVERLAASKNLKGQTLLFAFTEYRHKPSNIKYSVFNTFLNSIDGGITKGWIESSLSQEVVAEVEDGDFVNCTVIDKQLRKVENTPEESCLFGFELNQLMESSRFKAELAKEVFRTGRIPGEAKKRARYRMFRLTDQQKDRSSYNMYLRNSSIQGSKNFNGWIENPLNEEILALIGESEIYECIVDSLGVTLGKIVDSSEACAFGADFHDLEVSTDFVLSSLDAEMTRESRVRKSSRPMVFKRRALFHKPTGKSYIVFHTFRDQDDDGKTQGWIETIEGRLAAEIVENSIRNCHP